MWKAKKIKIVQVTALPRGAIGKEAFAERPWPLRSAILGKFFPSSGVPRFAERNGQKRSTK
jgi:hypothetical protein